jgi:hypothetical protein
MDHRECAGGRELDERTYLGVTRRNRRRVPIREGRWTTGGAVETRQGGEGLPSRGERRRQAQENSGTGYFPRVEWIPLVASRTD